MGAVAAAISRIPLSKLSALLSGLVALALVATVGNPPVSSAIEDFAADNDLPDLLRSSASFLSWDLGGAFSDLGPATIDPGGPGAQPSAAETTVPPEDEPELEDASEPEGISPSERAQRWLDEVAPEAHPPAGWTSEGSAPSASSGDDAGSSEAPPH